jgi:hypothetical protein
MYSNISVKSNFKQITRSELKLINFLQCFLSNAILWMKSHYLSPFIPKNPIRSFQSLSLFLFKSYPQVSQILPSCTSPGVRPDISWIHSHHPISKDAVSIYCTVQYIVTIPYLPKSIIFWQLFTETVKVIEMRHLRVRFKLYVTRLAMWIQVNIKTMHL